MKKECQSCPLLSQEELAKINKKLDGMVKLLEYLAEKKTSVGVKNSHE